MFIISASIGALAYDKKIKWDRIEYKKTLGDCAVDGILPEKVIVTPRQAEMEAIKWLERLDRDNLSVDRADLNVRLSPAEIEKRIVKYGDIAQLNKQFNKENSNLTHEKITKNPEILVEYHRQFRETKRDWPVKPIQVIADKIKGLMLPPRLISKMVIGDFGCGEAELAQLLNENKVYSFDHHNILNENIIACDMKQALLKDGELDVAIFSLSLMGRNWSDYIVEAKRCLIKNGYLFIAETTKSLKMGLLKLPEILKGQGFETYSSDEIGQFTFIEARKL